MAEEGKSVFYRRQEEIWHLLKKQLGFFDLEPDGLF